jgi:hypothetical protein
LERKLKVKVSFNRFEEDIFDEKKNLFEIIGAEFLNEVL